MEGLRLFGKNEGGSGRVPALMVLTDGMPNHMCPAQGYVAKLKAMERLPAAIHTFGFGYSLRSGLLKSVAEIGGGGYSFIPDAGMIVGLSLTLGRVVGDKSGKVLTMRLGNRLRSFGCEPPVDVCE